MKEKLQERLGQLQDEYKKGQEMMEELDQKKANLAKTLLRIEGAIQVLEEEIEKLELPRSTPTDENKN